MIKIIKVKISGNKYLITEIKNQDTFKTKCSICEKIPYKYYTKTKFNKFNIICLNCFYKYACNYPFINKDLKQFVKDYEKYLVLERL